MKIITIQTFILLCTLCMATNLVAQDCSVPQAQAELSVNNVNATIKNAGDLWWNGADARYIIPKPNPGLPEVAAIFAGGLWLGGYDETGNLKLAAQTYGAAAGQTDYFAGPLNDDGSTTAEQCNNFDQFWETTSVDINAHIADFADNGTIDNPLPSIMAWPGRSNPEFEAIHGFELPMLLSGLAPFFDENANGIYEPMQGDYPDINGADQGLWTVFNDAGGIHSSSQGDPIGAEIQLLAYSYASANEAVNNATFYDYKFFNKSASTIDSAFLALWVDADLGCYTDDYIGCVPDENLAYVYNMDAQDGDTGCSCPFGVNTYCEAIPLVGIKMLDGVLSPRVFGPGGELVYPAPGQSPDTLVNTGMSSFMYYENGGSNPPPPPGTTDPGIALEYHNYMSAKWRDGTPLTIGGNGYNPGSTAFTNYAFSDNPIDDGGWSMCSENLIAGDRRMVIGAGPFRMQPGSVNRLSFAVIYEADVAHPCPDVGGLVTIGEEIEDFFENGVPTNTYAPVYNAAGLQVYPNPLTDRAQLVLEGSDQLLEQVELYAIDGRLLRNYESLSANKLEIEKGDLLPGMYIYKAKTTDQKTYTGKIVVQ